MVAALVDGNDIVGVIDAVSDDATGGWDADGSSMLHVHHRSIDSSREPPRRVWLQALRRPSKAGGYGFPEEDARRRPHTHNLRPL